MVRLFNIEMCSALAHKLENAPLNMEIIYGVSENKIDMMDGGDIVNSNLHEHHKSWSMASYNLKFWNDYKRCSLWVPVFWISWTDQDKYKYTVKKTWDYIYKNIEFFINFM